MLPDEPVFLSVGSNLGDRLENCRQGINRLSGYGTTVLTGVSLFYLTEPVGPIKQDWFVNAVVRIRTDLSPEALLIAIKDIQHRAGRKDDSVRFGPRVLDLDILLFGARVVQAEGLVIPHPRMHERRFVLKPICDIDPDREHPVLKKSMKTLLNALDEVSQKVVAYP